jgi:hypothetical protein
VCFALLWNFLASFYLLCLIWRKCRVLWTCMMIEVHIKYRETFEYLSGVYWVIFIFKSDCYIITQPPKLNFDPAKKFKSSGSLTLVLIVWNKMYLNSLCLRLIQYMTTWGEFTNRRVVNVLGYNFLYLLPN